MAGNKFILRTAGKDIKILQDKNIPNFEGVYKITVSHNPPENPSINDLWIEVN